MQTHLNLPFLKSYFVLLFFLEISLVFLYNCSTTKSGINIPANQTFLLGELNDENYSAELTNKSNLIITVKVFNKKLNQIVEKFDLEPQVKKVMQISEKWTVHFINDNDRDVTVDAILSDGVPGMRYITNN